LEKKSADDEEGVYTVITEGSKRIPPRCLPDVSYDKGMAK
jgi:hypothetical protein